MAKYIKSSYKNYLFTIILFACLLSQAYNDCSICLNKLDENYLIDIWGNKFHQRHENESYYCNSCSRLISEALTHGGYKMIDGRHVCNLCYPNLVYKEYSIEESRTRVIAQLEKVGFKNLSYDIPIILLNKSKLLELAETDYHKNLKGLTIINKIPNHGDDYNIYILGDLHQIEFDAVLAHEYLHVWQNNYNIHWNSSKSEGLSSLGSELIYKNYNNTFSIILYNNMLNNNNSIYGDGYREMKKMKDRIGWDGLIKRITTNYSY